MRRNQTNRVWPLLEPIYSVSGSPPKMKHSVLSLTSVDLALGVLGSNFVYLTLEPRNMFTEFHHKSSKIKQIF